MKNRLVLALAAALSVALAGGVSAASSASGVNDGVAAYRAGEMAAAWTLLSAAADSDATAKRYLAYIILDGQAPRGEDADLFRGVGLLKEAAIAGDYAALIRLENLRRQRLAHSPSLDDVIAVETARAEKGDPVAAWRLAKRYETGDGVAASETGAAKWLEVAASAEAARFPKAGEAAYRLCEINALGDETRNPDAARRWCAIAAENGHTGAAIVLKRLAQLHG